MKGYPAYCTNSHVETSIRKGSKGNLEMLPFKHTRSERLQRQMPHRLTEVAVQAYLGDGVDVQLHEGTRVTGYAPNSEDAISKLNH